MNETNTLPTSANEQATNKPVVIRCGDFSGAFSRFQVACYGDLKLAGFSAEVSHKVAFDYGSDIGNAIRNASDDGLASKIGKAKRMANRVSQSVVAGQRKRPAQCQCIVRFSKLTACSGKD